MTRRRAARRAPAPSPTQYWLLATGGELARLLAGEVADALRTQAITLLKRDALESDALYLARLADVEATR
jgi:hypothetical protein